VIEPSSGWLSVGGRVAALLELGAGFNPEFSGHENIRLYATLLGLDKAELDRRYDAIVAFAEIDAFLDQPVKTYSTGMQARLAMAVAVNVSPEVLIIDEALSVGDEAFQRKCFARLEQVKEAGATILFVSHSAATIVDLCDWAMLIDHGERMISGHPKTVVGQYHRLLYTPPEEADHIRDEVRALDRDTSDPRVPPAGVAGGTAQGTGPSTPAAVDGADWFDPHFQASSTIAYLDSGAELSDIHLRNADGQKVNMVLHGRTYRLCYRVRFTADQEKVRFGCMMKALDGVELGGRVSHRPGEEMGPVAAGTEVEVRVPFRMTVVPGTYFFNAGVQALRHGEYVFLARLVDALMVRVQPVKGSLITGFNDFAPGEPMAIETRSAPSGVVDDGASRNGAGE